MKEKERYKYYEETNQLYDSEEDELYAYNLNNNKVISILNQQDKKIKELKGKIKTLKTSKTRFKKAAENVVSLLETLNKFIGSPQTRELIYYKVIEDTKNYIEELKHQIDNLQKINGEVIILNRTVTKDSQILEKENQQLKEQLAEQEETLKHIMSGEPI